MKTLNLSGLTFEAFSPSAFRLQGWAEIIITYEDGPKGWCLMVGSQLRYFHTRQEATEALALAMAEVARPQ